ncbi:MAG: hypothetical protein KBD12_02575 [Candidatus Pacebacteria bacterium]|nr:hypothetical protein [Candidatus Paceibacterota bacterium]
MTTYQSQISLPEGTITKKVKVNRNRTNKEAVKVTGRVQYLNDTVVAEMPSGSEEEIEIHFIPFKKQISPDNLDLEVDELGFKFVDPVALCAANEQDPDFANEHPNVTQWRDKKGKSCYLIFVCCFGDGRAMKIDTTVGSVDDDWYEYLLAACVPKIILSN